MPFELARIHPWPHLNHLPKVSSEILTSMKLVVIILFVVSSGGQKNFIFIDEPSGDYMYSKYMLTATKRIICNLK